jgi:AraC-like DNA-binding protein
MGATEENAWFQEWQEGIVCHYTVQGPGSRIALHYHRHHEIGLVENGAYTILLDGEMRRLEAGEVFLVPGNVPHGFVVDASVGVTAMIIQFAELAAELLSALCNAPPIGQFALTPAERDRFTEIYHQLHREVATDLPWARRQCRILLEQLAILLARSHAQGGLSHPTGRQHQAVQRALRWLHEHAHQHVYMSELAAYTGLSSPHLRRLFRQYVGMSPKRYLQALRLQASKSLLLQPDRPLAQVAESAGFGNPQQFSKAFRRYTGLSPSAWRRARVSSA